MLRILKSYSVVFAMKGGDVGTFAEFLEALLNRKLQINDTIRLSSAQAARVIIWAEKNNVILELSQIRQEFTLSSLAVPSSNNDESAAKKSTIRPDNNPKMIRLGNDIQLVSELFPDEALPEALNLQKLFTKYEIAYAEAAESPKVTLAGLFSLKESLIKAGATFDDYLDLEITHDNNGAPLFYGFLVSISHSGDYATSVALKLA